MKRRVIEALWRLDAYLGGLVCRRYPNFAKKIGLLQEVGMGGSMGFGAELEVKLIKGNKHEKEKLNT